MVGFKLTSEPSDIWGAAVGFFAALSQTVLLREALSVSQGNESATSISFIGWFIGVSSGALLAKGVLHRIGTAFVMSLFSGVSVVSGLLLLRMHRVVLDVDIGTEPSFAGMIFILTAGLGLGGLATGSLFTVTALRLCDKTQSPVSRLYAAESVGAVVGTLVFYFVLLWQMSHLEDLGIAAGFLFVCAVPLSTRGFRIVSALFAFAVSLAIVVGGLHRVDDRLEQRAFRALRSSKLVASTASAYGRLSLAEEAGQYEVLVDGRFDHAFPDPYERPVPIHVALTAHPAPKDILILGGGPTDRVEAALAHHPSRVVMTYLNDGVEALCRPYRPSSTANALKDPRVEQVEDDARRYVRNTKERFDVILVAARPPRSAAENRFYTEDFFRELSHILNQGGVIASIAAGGANRLSKEAALSAASTWMSIRSVFRATLIVPGLSTLILASDDRALAALNAETLAERYRRRDVRAPSFSASRFADLIDASRMRERIDQLERIHPSLNTDAHPVVYSAGLSLWERSLGTRESATSKETVTSFLIEHAAAFFLVPILLLLGVGVASLKRRLGPLVVSSVSIAVTGAAGMGAQIVIMFAFQAAFGTLYAAVALLLGTFMLGLAFGALIGRKWFAPSRMRHVLIADIAMIAFLVMTTPVLKVGAQTGLVLYLWSAIGGMVTGTAFPVFLGLASGARNRDERFAAPAVEFADHMGAAFGSLVTGLVWIPAFGIPYTCLLFAALKIAAAFAYRSSWK